MTVFSIPSSIPGDTQHVTVQPVFGHTGSHMRMMMLHRYQGDRQSRSEFTRKTGRAIVRMKIAGNGLWYDLKQLLEIHHRLPEGTVRFHSGKVT
jgi:hypothetical protein